jgi:hypothetical protein
MDEREWLGCKDPHPILIFLRGPTDNAPGSFVVYGHGGGLLDGPSERVSPRKISLFTSACCRRALPLPMSQITSKTLAVFLRHIEGEGADSSWFDWIDSRWWHGPATRLSGDIFLPPRAASGLEDRRCQRMRAGSHSCLGHHP